MKNILIAILSIAVIALLFFGNNKIRQDKQSIKHLQDSIKVIEKEKRWLSYEIDSLDKEKERIKKEVRLLSASEIELKLNYNYPSSDTLITIKKEAGRDCIEKVELLSICEQQLSKERSINNLLNKEIKINNQAYELRLNNKDIEIAKLDKKLKKNNFIKWVAIAVVGYKIFQDL